MIISIAVAINLVIAKLMATWSYSWFPPQASSAASYVDDLFALETGIGSFIFFGCTGVMGWVLLFNRAGKYDESDGAPIEGNTKLEIIWTDHSFGDWSSQSHSLHDERQHDSFRRPRSEAQVRHRQPITSALLVERRPHAPTGRTD